jgi:hypothetical protein
MASELSEKHDSLWWVAAAPGIWGSHFVACYGTAAVWCAKYGVGASLAGARIAIAVMTLLALVGSAGVALRGYRSFRLAEPHPRSDSDSVEARHRFIGFTLLSLSGLAALAIVYEALAAVFIGSCY